MGRILKECGELSKKKFKNSDKRHITTGDYFAVRLLASGCSLHGTLRTDVKYDPATALIVKSLSFIK